MTLFYDGIEVWGSAVQKKYLDRMDKLLRQAHRYGYTTKSIKMWLRRKIESYLTKLYQIQNIPSMNCS